MFVSLVTAFVLFSVMTPATSSSFEWHKFKRQYNKNYASASEEAMRREIFLENVNEMRVYQRTHPNATFTLAINHLADRRSEELNLPSEMRFHTYYSSVFNNSNRSLDLPDSLDWRNKNVITPVRDIAHSPIIAQGVAIELVESLHAIKTKSLELGSISRLADCCPLESDPFECITKLGGVCHDRDYPSLTGECIPNKCEPFMNFDNIRTLETRNENTMLTWIQDSPLYSGIDASSITFRLYKGGIYQDSSCSPSVIGRRMQVVGYGQSDSGEPFWLCKNSFGTQWGENGYMRVLRGKNMCGIATQVIQIA